MRIHLIRKETLEEFGTAKPMSRVALEAFISKVKYAEWSIPKDILHTFSDADILGRGSSRVIFNINGNRYRMICKYVFGKKQVHLFVCWIGVHAEYDALCLQNRQFDISLY